MSDTPCTCSLCDYVREHGTNPHSEPDLSHNYLKRTERRRSTQDSIGVPADSKYLEALCPGDEERRAYYLRRMVGHAARKADASR